MSYPNLIRAYLQNLGGSSCGTAQQQLEWDSSAAIPTFNLVSGAGDFATASCRRVDLGNGNFTWELTLMKLSGACAGYAEFRRNPAADNPVGSYCKYVSGQLDCDAGQANVQDDDP